MTKTAEILVSDTVKRFNALVSAFDAETLGVADELNCEFILHWFKESNQSTYADEFESVARQLGYLNDNHNPT